MHETHSNFHFAAPTEFPRIVAKLATREVSGTKYMPVYCRVAEDNVSNDWSEDSINYKRYHYEMNQ